MRGYLTASGIALPAIMILAQLAGGCGGNLGVFNSSFLNTFFGGSYPLTPGPTVPFIQVRAVNQTDRNIEFIVTVERDVIETDENGDFLFDESGQPVVRMERETNRLVTEPGQKTNEIGVLFDCSQFPVTRIGLGENLLPTDAAVFVGGGGAMGSAGYGIPAGDLNPLVLEEGNFNCGDTVIFQALASAGIPGGVDLQVFLLPGSEQPSDFLGPSTFENLAEFLESQVGAEEGP